MDQVRFLRKEGRVLPGSILHLASREMAVTQLHADSADVPAVVAHVGGRRLVLMSVYVPDVSSSRKTKEENMAALASRLETMQELVQAERLHDPHGGGDSGRLQLTQSTVGRELRQQHSKAGGERADRVISWQNYRLSIFFWAEWPRLLTTEGARPPST